MAITCQQPSGKSHVVQRLFNVKWQVAGHHVHRFSTLCLYGLHGLVNGKRRSNPRNRLSGRNGRPVEALFIFTHYTDLSYQPTAMASSTQSHPQELAFIVYHTEEGRNSEIVRVHRTKKAAIDWCRQQLDSVPPLPSFTPTVRHHTPVRTEIKIVSALRAHTCYVIDQRVVNNRTPNSATRTSYHDVGSLLLVVERTTNMIEGFDDLGLWLHKTKLLHVATHITTALDLRVEESQRVDQPYSASQPTYGSCGISIQTVMLAD